MKETANTEEEMRDTQEKHPQTIKELEEYIGSLVHREHDYGICVYAVSLASVATFNYVAHELGITGFQASCADLDVLRRTRHLKYGFRIVDYEHLLYPQYLNSEHFPTHKELLEENKKELAKAAREKLNDTQGSIHSEVKARWEYVASLSNEEIENAVPQVEQ